MIPKYYEFHCPVKIISGHKALANLPYEMTLLGMKNALVVTDQGVVAAGLLKLLENAMKDADNKIGYIYDKTPIDSSVAACNEIGALFRRHKCDGLIALGGGSAIDSAKGANIVISEGTDDLLKFQGMDRLTAPTQPFIIIPTTAGTGSEATQAAVIKNVDKNVKMPFISDKLYPDLAILDPDLTLGLPPKMTAATGMDALTHAVEAYVDLQKNPMSDAYAVAAIKIIFTDLLTCVKNPKNKQARLAMANAALFAGIAFSNAMVGVVHAMAHASGGICKVPHGIANSILLPFGMDYNLDKRTEEFAELAAVMGLSNLPAKPMDQAKAAIQAVRDLSRTLHDLTGLPLTLKEAGVPEEKLPEIAKGALNDGSMIHNPKEVSFEDCLEILKRAY